jgi:hypothetical protein
MNIRKWLIFALAIVTVMSAATFAGVTGGLFVDDEQSSDDALGFRWGLTTLDDSFEGTPWDANWDENGTPGSKMVAKHTPVRIPQDVTTVEPVISPLTISTPHRQPALLFTSGSARRTSSLVTSWSRYITAAHGIPCMT